MSEPDTPHETHNRLNMELEKLSRETDMLIRECTGDRRAAVAKAEAWVAPFFNYYNPAARLPTTMEFNHLWESLELSSWTVRGSYTTHSFLALTEDLMLAIKRTVEELRLKVVGEVGAGEGWLSFWLRRYGVPVGPTIDNKSWKQFKNPIPTVIHADGVEAVRNTKGIDLWLLSWPPMHDFAFNVWQSLQPGQYLLYFGERGGCTADDSFHEAVEPHEVEDKWGLDAAMYQFHGIRDHAFLFKKP